MNYPGQRRDEDLQGDLFAGGHPGEDALLRFLDGELEPEDAAVIEGHLRSCTPCALQRDVMRQAITDFADFQNQYDAFASPSAPAAKQEFTQRLREAADELDHPSSLSRILGWLSGGARAFRPFFVPVSACAAALLLAVIAFSSIHRLRRAPEPSASKLLDRALRSEQQAVVDIQQPVIVQKLSIRASGSTLMRTVYSDLAHKRSASLTDGNASAESVVRAEFEKSGMDWAHPLSVEQYQRWREVHQPERDKVEHLEGNLLRLETKTRSGPIAEASLTFRAEDAHPVEERLQLRDHSRIEVAELSYQVVGFAELRPGIFGPMPSAPAVIPVPVPGSEAQLAMTELEVRSVLHSLHADLGEEIDAVPAPDGSLLVRGMVATDARRRQILSALATIPHTETRLETAAEAAAHETAPALTPAATATPPRPPGVPLLEVQLREKFPDETKRTQYINQALLLAQGASARAWALNRLAERYTPQQVALLDVTSRQSLSNLLNDHVTAMREDVNRLQAQLAPVLATAGPAPGAAAIAPVERGDWRHQVGRVHSDIETLNESVTALLTETGSSGDESSKQIESGLRATLLELQADLKALSRQLQKPF